MLPAELFLQENYLFRRNILSGKVEFVTKSAADETAADHQSDWRPLTQEALNSIVIKAKREDICDGGNPKTDIVELLHSEEVRVWNPIQDYLEHLPQWDGQNHVARLFSRLPGLSSEQFGFFAVWMRSMVAHWLQMDKLHGNECVPTLIGAQGCGKTTFVQRLLPPYLRQYFLDHLNLSNKFDKEMALTNNLLVNLDELEAIRPSQHAALKQTLSKSKVNGRPIYGCAQEDRPRFASFVATTNNPHPLHDATGSRRFICIRISKGKLIDNEVELDYEQLYAQVLHELRCGERYWFTAEETRSIQRGNIPYHDTEDIELMFDTCFRQPEDDEFAQPLTMAVIMDTIHNQYPGFTVSQGAKVQLGRVLSRRGFLSKELHNGIAYYVIPLAAA
jgi:hypothetical protein